MLVVIVGTLGLLHDSWPKVTQSYWINLHALIGLFLWGVLLARLTWRMGHVPPTLPKNAGALAQRLSTPVHFALYGLLFVIPILGFITFIYHGRVFDLGLFHVDFGIKKNKAVFAPTEDFHGYFAYALFALAGLHIAAALWHQFYLRDGLMLRMWPRRSNKTEPADP